MTINKKTAENVFVVAELSANHNHNFDLAKKTIEAAARAGADAIKLQTYTADTMTIDCDNEYFKIKGTIWDGRKLYDLYKEAYTPWEWHADLFKCARDNGMICFSTPFDFSAVDFLETLNNPIYKIASFEITDIPLIKYAAAKMKPMIISTGIADHNEIKKAVNACREVGNNDITLLQCTSSYPAPVEYSNLKMIPELAREFNVISGLSDHTLGSTASVAAVAVGAKIIEKHFILDRKLGGPDATFSMQPEEFRKMVDEIRIVEKALGKVDYSITAEKLKGRGFARSLFFVKDIEKGQIITSEHIRSIRPGDGIAPEEAEKLIGRRVLIDVERGTPVSWNLIEKI